MLQVYIAKYYGYFTLGFAFLEAHSTIYHCLALNVQRSSGFSFLSAGVVTRVLPQHIYYGCCNSLLPIHGHGASLQSSVFSVSFTVFCGLEYVAISSPK